jgi:hypothetical protein
MVWVPAVAEDAQTLSELERPPRDPKCAVRRDGRQNPCNARAVAVVRDAPEDRFGHYRCTNHMDGRWVDAGIVFTWVLEEKEEPGA